MHDPRQTISGPARSTCEIVPGVAGVILAGGKSTRMGGVDKALVEVGGKPMITHAVARLKRQTPTLAINSNNPESDYSKYRLPVISDGFEDRLGPLAGVLAGLKWAAKKGCPLVVTAAGDTPFFPIDLVERLHAAIKDSELPIALAATRNQVARLVRHPTFGLWPTRLADDLEEALVGGVRKVVHWTDRHGAATVEFPCGEYDPFFNINTPEDVDRANSMLEAKKT